LHSNVGISQEDAIINQYSELEVFKPILSDEILLRWKCCYSWADPAKYLLIDDNCLYLLEYGLIVNWIEVGRILFNSFFPKDRMDNNFSDKPVSWEKIMEEQNSSDSFSQIMELRAIIRLLLKHKWFIIIFTVVLTACAILSSMYLITPRYSSSAFVTLIEPIMNAEFESSIQISPIIPDSQALAEVVETDEIIRAVVEKLVMEEYFRGNKPGFEASLRGKSQLLLTASDSDPDIAADLANTWAEVVVNRLNDVYGSGEFNQVEFDGIVMAARTKWEQTQEDLENYLPGSKVSTLEVELSQIKNKLARYFDRVEDNIVLIEDVMSLENRLAELNSYDNLPSGEALSLIALQQRMSGEISGAEFQVEGFNLLGEEYKVAEARETITVLILSLQEQNSHLQDEIDLIKEEIAQVSVDLESGKHQLERLTQERDLAREAYIALSNQMEENRITSAGDASVAKISSPAIASINPSSMSKMVITALAGIAGLALSILSILIYEWWKAGETAV
jgi:capsular polysaccharide biosynthesis protein